MGKRKKTKETELSSIKRILPTFSKLNGSELNALESARQHKNYDLIRKILNKPIDTSKSIETNNRYAMSLARLGSQYTNFMLTQNKQAKKFIQEKLMKNFVYSSNPIDDIELLARFRKPIVVGPPRNILQQIITPQHFNYVEKTSIYLVSSQSKVDSNLLIEVMRKLKFSNSDITYITKFIAKIRFYMVLIDENGKELIVSTKVLSIYMFYAEMLDFINKYFRNKSLTKQIITGRTITLTSNDYYYEYDYIFDDNEPNTKTVRIIGLKSFFINYYKIQ